MTPLQSAFLKWSSLLPQTLRVGARDIDVGGGKIVREPAHWDGHCCYRDHTRIRLNTMTGLHEEIPMLDGAVCERERAWREYVRLRDGVTVQ